MLNKLVQNIIQRVSFDNSRYTWIEWIFTNKNNSAITTRDFFNTCYLNLPEDKRESINRDLKNETIENVASLLYELIAHELFGRLKVKPIFKPKIDNKKPDLKISVNGQDFIVDVFLTHNPGKTIKPLKKDSQVIALKDSGDRAEKITEAITGKASKYKKLDIPLVLFGFLGDMDILSVENVFESLLGVFRNCTKFELSDIKNGVIARKKKSGVYLPNLNGASEYRNLSAVISCQWFDSAKHDDTGKRFELSVFHHWDPTKPLPEELFSNFPQLIWKQKGPNTWEWTFSKERNIVFKFENNNKLHIKPYNVSNNSW